MDALTDLLRGVHARGATLCRSFASPPWSFAFAAASLTLITSLRSDAWLLAENGTRALIRAGDIGLVRGPMRLVLADDPSTPPQIEIDESDCERWRVGTRTYGFRPDGDAMLMTGSYEVEGSVSDRLLNALPHVFVVPCGDEPCLTLDLLSEEIAKDRPGQDIVLDRLLDLLLVFALREWFVRPEANAPAWYRALGDEVVGPALRVIHDDPQRAWTVAELAARAGVSRAALARRFTALVGVPPLTYLTEWRMDLAADLLAQPSATIGSVARAVGYADAFAFSTAFKRVRGVRPSDHRVVALRA